MICCGNKFHSSTCLVKALARVEELEGELAEARNERDRARAQMISWRDAVAGLREYSQTAIALEDALFERERVGDLGGTAALDEIRRAHEAWGNALAASRAAREARKRIYPCTRCGTMRSKDEGGTTFTVCDACWDKPRKP